MKKLSYTIIVLLCIFAYSCKDIIEEDLSEQTVIINAPPNNYVTESITQTFWWNKLEGAQKYNLQIVSPSFSSVETLVLDTNVSGDKYTYTLNPGNYEWRIKAYNASSETAYTTYTITIDSTADLSSQQVVLISPVNQLATNSITITFQWYHLYNAVDYRFEIRTPDWNGDLVINPMITEHDTLTLTLAEGFYVWGVQAQNSTSSSPFSSRSLVVDTTSPGIPVLLLPADDAVINDSTLTNSNILFNWQRGTNTGSAIWDSLYVGTDSTFSGGLIISAYLSDTSYTYSFSNGNDYYWKVRSIDDAGNYGGYSVIRKFTYEE